MPGRTRCIAVVFVALVSAADRSAADGPVSPPASALVAELPFMAVSDEARAIYIDLAPDGNPSFPMVLDTGAETSVVTPRLARKLGVSVRRHRSSPYRRKTRLGRDVQFVVPTASSDTSADKGWEYGLLGADFLDDYVVELDYPGRVVRFYDPDRFRVPERAVEQHAHVIPFERAGTRILVDFEIDRRSVRALLDTGAGLTGVFSGELVRSVGVDPDDLPYGRPVMTTQGPIETKVFETDGFVLGGFEFDRIGFLVASRGIFNIGGPSDSLLGHDVLSQFVVRIDYPRRLIWLKSGPSIESVYGGVPWERARIDFFEVPPTPAEREATRAEAADRDEAWNDQWKSRQASRLYVEENGGWQVVDDVRRRLGPKPGEEWVGYDEMMEIRRQREADPVAGD